VPPTSIGEIVGLTASERLGVVLLTMSETQALAAVLLLASPL
jgi:hypothetical protein